MYGDSPHCLAPSTCPRDSNLTRPDKQKPHAGSAFKTTRTRGAREKYHNSRITREGDRDLPPLASSRRSRAGVETGNRGSHIVPLLFRDIAGVFPNANYKRYDSEWLILAWVARAGNPPYGDFWLMGYWNYGHFYSYLVIPWASNAGFLVCWAVGCARREWNCKYLESDKITNAV